MRQERNGKTKAAEAPSNFVSDYLLYLLAAASHAASNDFYVQVRACGLRVPEWRVLACLSDNEGQMVTRLAELALMEQSRLTKIIDQMAEKGLVARRSDDRDRRRVRVFLAPAGRALADKLVAAAKHHEAGIIDQLSPGDAALIKHSLKRIHALFGRETETNDLPAGEVDPMEEIE